MTKMKQIILKERPVGKITEASFETKEVRLNGLHDSELHLKLVFLSVDPYLLGRMNNESADMPSFKRGEPIKSTGVLRVIRSESRDFEEGDLVVGQVPWQEEVIVSEKKVRKIDTSFISAKAYLGVIGMTGLTAYFGLLDIGKPKKGETVVVSAAAGAVGSTVGQIAQIKGAHVIGITGTDDKARYLVKEIGFNAAVNYHDSNFAENLKRACPNGVDVYFESVGGEISEAVWPLLNKFARIPVCGTISNYNSPAEEDVGPRVQRYLIQANALMQGFSVTNYKEDYKEATAQLVKWLREGKLTHKETVLKGFDQIVPAFISLFEGKNMGKIIVEMTD